MQIQRYFSADRSAAARPGFFRRVRVTLAAENGAATESEVTAPADWELGAVEAFARHGLLPSGVPHARQRLAEAGVPPELQACTPLEVPSRETTGAETDIRSAVSRVAGALARAGMETRLFRRAEDALAFRDELEACLLSRRITLAPALWQGIGAHWAYGATPASAAAPDGDRRTEADDLTTRLRASRGRDRDAAALALGRALLDELSEDMASAFEDDASTGALRMVLGRAEELGLPAAAARRLIDEHAAGIEPLAGGDTHLDFDSDIWDLLGTPQDGDAPARLTSDTPMDELVAASYLGRAPELVLTDADVSADGAHVPCGHVDVLKFDAPSRGGSLDVDGLCHAVHVLAVALDLAHEVMACGGDDAPCRTGRPIAVAPMNLASLVMSRGMAYGSDEGRALAATVSALVTAATAATSTLLAEQQKPCDAQHLTDDLAAMQRALLGHAPDGGAMLPMPLFPYTAEQARVLDRARLLMGKALDRAAVTGLRNGALTALPADEDAARMMSAESAGIAPMARLVHFRRLTPDLDPDAIYKTISPSVPAALRALHHDDASIEALLDHVVGRGTLEGAPGVNYDLLRERGFTDDDMDVTEAALATAATIRAVFTPYVLGWDDAIVGSTDILSRLGFSDWDVEHANFYCCGAQTLEGARDLPVEQLEVFDCAAPLGQIGTRQVAARDRLLMAQAVQSFVTGPVTLDVTLPPDSNADEIAALYSEALTLGLRRLRLNRDAASLCDPLDYDDLLDGDDMPAGDIEAAVQVRAVESDMAFDPQADGISSESNMLATLVSVGLANGVPLSAYETALAEIGVDMDDAGIRAALREMASGFLARPQAGSAADSYDPLMQDGARHGHAGQHPSRGLRGEVRLPATATDTATDTDISDEDGTIAGPASGKLDTGAVKGAYDIVVSPADGPVPPSPSFGDPAYSPPSVSGRDREE